MLDYIPIKSKIRLILALLAISVVGLFVEEYGAACEGSIHFDLLHVAHRDQHVVLQLLEHLWDTQTRLSLEKLTSGLLRFFCVVFIDGYYKMMSAEIQQSITVFSQMSLEKRVLML